MKLSKPPTNGPRGEGGGWRRRERFKGGEEKEEDKSEALADLFVCPLAPRQDV